MSTPDNITELQPNEILVFGSNSAGHHIGGAARVAYEKFGARWGVGEGLVGQSYALPTLTKDLKRRTHKALEFSSNRLAIEANIQPSKTFYLTKVGCGIAGFTEDYMKQFFKNTPPNVIKPAGW